MANWWNYLDEKEYRKWRAEEFVTKARDEFARRRQPKPEPLPEPEEGGGGGLLGGLKKLGGLALKPFELERKYISGPIAETYMKIPKPVRIGLAAPTGVGALAQAFIPEKATKEAATILASPSTYVGLGLGAKAATKIPAVAKYAPAISRLEDVAIGGPAFRAAGRGIMAPFKAATRRFAPDVPRSAGIRAKMLDEKAWAEQEESARKLVGALKEHVRPAREATELKYTARKAEQAAQLEKIPTGIGEEALAEQRRILTGPLPKAELKPLGLEGKDINNLYNRINQADIQAFDKVAAREALVKLLDPAGPEIPGLAEIARLEKLFGPEFVTGLRDLRGLGSKAREAALDAINLPRAVLASYDISAPGRQGLLMLGAKPKSWAIGVMRGFRWMFDPDYARDRWAWYFKPAKGTEIHPRQAFIAERAKGRLLMEPGGPIGATQEEFGSNLARAFPGVPMSERVYVGQLDEMRWHALFDEIGQREQQIGRGLNLTGKGKGARTDLKFLDDQIEALASMTGRADLPGFLKKQEPLIGAGLFAPRLLWARLTLPFQALKNKNARWMIARGYAGAALGNATALAMLKATGLIDVEINPLSTDFGKGRVGRTRFDFLGGYQPIVRYAAQLATGQRKTTVAGEIYPVDRKETVFNFLRTKLSPVVGVATDIATGTTMLGDPVTGEMLEEGEFWNQVKQRMVPMFIQDFEEAIREQSDPLKGAFLATPGAFGASVMSYAWPAQKMDELSRKVMGQGYKDLNFLERKQLLDKSPEAREVWLEYVEMGVKRGQDWAEGTWEMMESNAELQARLVEALDAGAMKANLAADFTYYRSSAAYDGDDEREPRDEQEALMIGYFAIKPEDFRRPDGTTDFGAFYDARRQYIEDNNQTQEFFNENELLKWDDPTMRDFVAEWQRANDLWSQYYELPTKLGMSPEEQEEARNALARVTTLQFGQPGLSTRRALMQLDVPDRVKFLALRYSRLRTNPEREAFRTKHGMEMALIKPPEFGAAVTEEEAY